MYISFSIIVSKSIILCYYLFIFNNFEIYGLNNLFSKKFTLIVKMKILFCIDT